VNEFAWVQNCILSLWGKSDGRGCDCDPQSNVGVCCSERFRCGVGIDEGGSLCHKECAHLNNVNQSRMHW